MGENGPPDGHTGGGMSCLGGVKVGEPSFMIM
jgi:hypothetical protein